MADEESFLARWSRRKRADPQARAAEEQPAPVSSPGSDRGEPPADPELAAEPSSLPDELPPVDSLGKDSDYTAFLRAGVPEAVRRQALRKLWTSDPVLANLDGLLDYDEDFRAAFLNPEVVKTLYRVGEGMGDILDDEGRETTPAADPPAPESAGQPGAAGAENASASDDPAEEGAGEIGGKTAAS